MKCIKLEIRNILSQLENLSKLEKLLPKFEGRLLLADIDSIKTSLNMIKYKENKKSINIYIDMLKTSEQNYCYYQRHPGARELLRKSLNILSEA
jgi:hypothetical protein